MKRLRLSFRGQGKWALLSAVILGALVSPFAIANDGDTMRVGAGNSAIEKETNISGQKVKTFATRQSNNLEGDGGSATYGCRSSFANEPCLDVFALRTARAFDFRSRGNEGGRIRVEGSPNPRLNRPFTTNATGVATGLNADEVDGLDAPEILAAARAKLGLDADTLDGKDSTDFVAKSELLWALIDGDVGSATVVRTRGATGASSPGTGRYVVTFDRDISTCGIQATLGDATGASGAPGEISADQPSGSSVEINTYDSAGAAANTLASNGFQVQVTC